MVMDVIWHQLCVSMINVWWRCAQYFVIASCGKMPGDNSVCI